MSYIWKRFQRLNKRATKCRYVCVFNQLIIEGSSKWQPHKLNITLSHRRRKLTTTSRNWEPTIRNPYRGIVIWPVEEGIEMTLTLFRGMKDPLYEEKVYNLLVEETNVQGKCKPIAYVKINFAQYANVDDSGLPCHQEESKLTLIPLTKKLVQGEITISISSQFIKEGLASDEDMISIASLLSMQAATNEDIGNLKDFEDSTVNQSTVISAELSQLVSEISEFANHSSALSHANSSKVLSGINSPEKEPSVAKLNADEEKQEPRERRKEEEEEEDEKEQSGTNAPSLPPSASMRKQMQRVTCDDFDQNELETILNSQRIPSNIEVANGEKVKEHQLQNTVNSGDPADVVDSHTPHPPACGDETALDAVTKCYLDKADVKNTRTMDGGSSSLKEVSILEIESSSDVIHLKSNLSKPLEESSPSDHLLNWCKSITSNYQGVRVTNMTTSWRNGLAFCAILHYFRPDLVDFKSLSPSNIQGNCKIAFNAFASLGIPRIIDPKDMARPDIDKLNVITYLYQLKEYFTSPQPPSCQVRSVKGNSTSPTSTVMSNDKDDKNVPESSIHHLQSTINNDVVVADEDEDLPVEFSLARLKSKNWKSRRNQVKNNTQDQANDFKVDRGSGESEQTNNSSNVDLPQGSVQTASAFTCPVIKTDYSSLNLNLNSPFATNRAKPNNLPVRVTPPVTLIPKFFAHPKDESPLLDSSKSTKLREKARKLMAEATNRSFNDANDVTSCSSSSSSTFAKISPVTTYPNYKAAFDSKKTGENSAVDGRLLLTSIANNGEPFCIGTTTTTNTTSTSTATSTCNSNTTVGASTTAGGTTTAVTEAANTTAVNGLTSGNSVNPNPGHLDNNDCSYAKKELEALEKEQQLIDAEASLLEKKLRIVMKEGESKGAEEVYLKQWFNLVNKKNALIRRQMQLNLLQQEQDLELRYALLNNELRSLIAVQESEKTDAQKEKEKSLLAELVDIVDKRNELVQSKACQEQAMEDDAIVESVVNKGHIKLCDNGQQQQNTIDLLAAGTAAVDAIGINKEQCSIQ